MYYPALTPSQPAVETGGACRKTPPIYTLWMNLQRAFTTAARKPPIRTPEHFRSLLHHRPAQISGTTPLPPCKPHAQHCFPALHRLVLLANAALGTD